MSNRFIVFLLFSLLLLSCKNKEKVIISGTIENAVFQNVVLNELSGELSLPVDSAKTTGKGTFRMVYHAREPQYLRLGFNGGESITLLVMPGEKIGITARYPDILSSYTVTGSVGSLQVKKFEDQVRATRQKLDSISTLYNAVGDVPANASRFGELRQEYSALVNSLRSFSIRYILENITSLSSIIALYQKVDEENFVLYKTTDLQYLKIVLDSLSVYFPGSKYTQALSSDFNSQMAAYKTIQLQQMAGDVITTGIDLHLPGPSGDTISLSSLRGKYVLLSFWATWNPKSIEENNTLKVLYNRYHPNGFEVYQVSLDNDAEVWKKAIAFYELPWISVSELKYPASRYDKIYNIWELPSNFMLDTEGEIIGKNLFGNELRMKLSQIYD